MSSKPPATIAGQAKAPAGQVVTGWNADRAPEVRCKARTRHAGQPGHDAAVNQLVRHGMAQEQDHKHLGEAVHHRAVSTTAGLCLADQQLLGEIEARQLGQRHAQQGRQPAQQRVLVTDAEID